MTTNLSKRALFSAGALSAGVGAMALLSQRAAADTPFTSFAFPASGAPIPRTMPDRLADVRNVKDFGALGNGVADDRAAIQAAFDAAFGPANSPHGNSNRFSNRTVIIPPGDYRISGPLYLTNVMSGQILGGGQNSTRLQFTGSYNGNTVVGNGITPLIMTNGLAYSRISDLNLAIGNNNSVGLYLFQNGAQGITTGNLLENILFEGSTAGALIGWQSNALCSEQHFLNCTAMACTYGFRVISQNSLNIKFDSCGASQCAQGFSCPLGNMIISNASLANNGVDVYIGGNSSPQSISGSRTESANFVDTGNNDAPVTITGCLQDNAAAGYFVNVGSSGIAILDGNVATSTTATHGVISGSSSSKIYLRGNQFRNTSYLANFTGTVAQNI